jgi:hypothetical protein
VLETDDLGYTALLEAAFCGHIQIMHWLLTEGGSSLTEKDTDGTHALSQTASNSHFPAMQYLLKEQGASIKEKDNNGDTVWDELNFWGDESAAELSSLLKVMVMLDDAPADFNTRLLQQHADICTQGRQLRAQLPSYLEQQRAAVVAHCFLPAVLQCLVAAYAVTTPDDMWTDGLRVQAPRAREAGKAEREDAPPPLRSRRLRKKRP